MNNKYIETTKEEKRKNDIFFNIHKKENKNQDIKSITELNYELGLEYFINTKSK